MIAEDHNAARWLEVRYLPTKLVPRIGAAWCAAWYVVRICECHYGERITLPLDTQEQAERALAVMVENSLDQIKNAALTKA